MAKQAYVEIEFFPESSELTYSSTQNNNVSNVDQLGEKSDGFKGLYVNGGWKDELGRDVGTLLNGQYRLFPDEGYPGWNGNELSGTVDTGNGYSFTTPQVVSFSADSTGEGMPLITIYFDPRCGEYATEYRLGSDSSTTIRRNNSYILIVEDLGDSDSIIITKWNKANSVAKITSIRYGFVGQYDPLELKSVDLDDNSVSSMNSPSFGIMSQTGRIEIYNLLQQFNILDNAGLLNDNITVVVKAFDVATQTPTDYVVATRLVNEWKFDENKPIVELTVKDRLDPIQQINLTGYSLAQRTGLQIFEDIFSQLSWAEGVDYRYATVSDGAVINTRAALSRYIFPNHYGTFKDAHYSLDDIAISTMCRVYVDREGLVVVERMFTI